MSKKQLYFPVIRAGWLHSMNKHHPVVDEIVSLLKKGNYWHETFEHEPVRTSEEAARTRPGYALHQGAKALIVKVTLKDSSEFLMLVLPADQKFSNAKVKKLFTADEVRFATPEEISAITNGVQIGGVPPFGNLFKLRVIADPSLFLNEKIVFNAGDRSFSVAIYSRDYKKIVTPEVADIIDNY